MIFKLYLTSIILNYFVFKAFDISCGEILEYTDYKINNENKRLKIYNKIKYIICLIPIINIASSIILIKEDKKIFNILYGEIENENENNKEIQIKQNYGSLENTFINNNSIRENIEFLKKEKNNLINQKNNEEIIKKKVLK